LTIFSNLFTKDIYTLFNRLVIIAIALVPSLSVLHLLIEIDDYWWYIGGVNFRLSMRWNCFAFSLLDHPTWRFSCRTS